MRISESASIALTFTVALGLLGLALWWDTTHPQPPATEKVIARVVYVAVAGEIGGGYTAVAEDGSWCPISRLGMDRMPAAGEHLICQWYAQQPAPAEACR